MNSKRKGSAAELHAARAIKSTLGVDARRGLQYRGGAEVADVVTDAPLHPEVKHLKRIAILDALRQAERDAQLGRIPFALVRENGDRSWVVVVRLSELPALARVITK